MENQRGKESVSFSQATSSPTGRFGRLATSLFVLAALAFWVAGDICGSQTFGKTNRSAPAELPDATNSTTNYWTEKARVGESVTNLHSVSCKRARDYAQRPGHPTDEPSKRPQLIVRVRSQPTQKREQSSTGIDSKTQQAQTCKNIDSRIDWLNSRLRAGYRAAQGERWKQELRDLKKKRYERC